MVIAHTKIFTLETKTKNSLAIFANYNQEYNEIEKIEIADIIWSQKWQNCYIKTIKDNFQNNVVLYNDFKDFIYLVDTAFDKLQEIKNKKRV